MAIEHEMALAYMATPEVRAQMDDYFGRTPAEAMAKLKQRNPDYDHHPQPVGGFKSGPVLHETQCDCGRTIRLVNIDTDGMHYTHQTGQPTAR